MQKNQHKYRKEPPTKKRKLNEEIKEKESKEGLESTEETNTQAEQMDSDNGDKRVEFNSALLCAFSEVFKAALTGGMLETKKKEIEILPCKLNTIHTLLHYICTGDIKHDNVKCFFFFFVFFVCALSQLII